MELAWRHQIMDFAMPYLIQVTRELTTKVDRLEKSDAERQTEAAEQDAKQPMMIPEPQLMLTAGPGMGKFCPHTFEFKSFDSVFVTVYRNMFAIRLHVCICLFY